MAVLKCKMCGGDVELSQDKTFGTCDCCGSTMTFPKVSDEQRAALFNRGNHFRRTGEFDKALAIYENIVREDDTDAEAHWCCALCRFGIEYVEDPTTYEYIPTCHRASFDSFLEDVDYLAAVEHSDGITRRQYQKDAAKIAEVQRSILATSQNEKPFDVFICYKETDEATHERTKDSIDAQEIYYQLTNEGYRVFFARITLEDKAGAEYEPYIFAALNSAKVMVVIGSKTEYFNAVWVKNEWGRFLAMMRKDRSKLLLPCYKGMDPYDLPEQLSVLQSYDMAKIGFMQDLIRGIKKVVNKNEPKATVKETVVIGGNSSNVAPLLKRAFIFLEDGNWNEADEYCEKVLDQDPENAGAYLGKLMAELRAHKQEELADVERPFEESNNYKKAVRFGGDKLASELNGYIDHINERNENARLTGIYNGAVSAMNAANTESAYKAAADTFRSISGFQDADALTDKCLGKAEECRKDAIYYSATSQMARNSLYGFNSAIKTFETIPGWRDAEHKINVCQKEIEKINEEEKRARIAAENQRKALEKAAKKRKKIALIVALVLILAVAAVVVYYTVIMPNLKYNAAVDLYNAGKYDEAITAFKELNGYKDSAEQITKCKTVVNDLKYDSAVALIEKGDIINAYESLIALNGYKDSTQKANDIFSQYKMAKLKAASVGDIVYFGSYEQDNNTSNGKEDVKWLVLAREGNKALVISKYALDCQQYNTSYTSVTWETCSLRKWLNGTFLRTAFCSEEQKSIISSTVTADKNPSSSTSPGNNTTDKVFLLSITEANKYFSSDSARQCSATAYAKAQGAYTNIGNGNCWWWLRSPGSGSNYAACVFSDGSVYNLGYIVSHSIGAVRPALWINLGD